ncbi:MAG: hypothetical protein AABZ74_06740 [Cyanobacteriota bacterium]
MKKINFLSLTVFFTIIFNNLAAFSCQDRAKCPSVKSNMHTFQTLLETYSVDHNGNYPKNVEELKKDATKGNNKYWKDFKNPYTNQEGTTFDLKIKLDKNDSNIVEKNNLIIGSIFYEPIKNNKIINGYKIYAICEGNRVGGFKGFLNDTINGVKSILLFPFSFFSCGDQYVTYFGTKKVDFIKDSNTNEFFILSNN